MPMPSCPIVLLNLGQTEAFSWAQTFAVRRRDVSGNARAHPDRDPSRSPESDSLVLAGASLVLLPLTFGGGLVFAALMVPWLLYQGWVVPRTIELVPSPRRA